MNTRILALTLGILCQPAFAGPPVATDTGAQLAAQSAAAAARIQADQRRELARAPERLALPGYQAVSPTTPLPEMDAPVALTLPPARKTGEVMR